MKFRINQIIDHVKSHSSDPKLVASSISIGLFFGILLPMGTQSLVVVPIALYLRVNVYIAMSATLITNPLTVAPLYYVSILIGKYITSFNFNREEIQGIINSPNYENLLSLGREILISLVLGNLCIAILISITSYFLIPKILSKLKRKRSD